MLAAGEPVSRVSGRVGYDTPSAFVAAFLTRLQTVGFAAITLRVSYNLVFTARKGSAP